jgi:hypothetical protein
MARVVFMLMNVQEIQKIVVELIVHNLHVLNLSGLNPLGSVVRFVVLMFVAQVVAVQPIILTVVARHVPTVTNVKLIKLVSLPFAVHEGVVAGKSGVVIPNVRQNVEFKPPSFARLCASSAVIAPKAQS